MNHTEVITKVAEQTGISIEVCERIIKAFEKQSEEGLENRFKGIKLDEAAVLAGIQEKSGCSQEDCQVVVAVLQETLDTGLSEKLRFFKRK